MLKNKRAALIVGAIVFVAVIFLLKTKSEYKSQAALDSGLSYGNIMVKDLLNKDTDLDGVLDWQENLMGTDPTKKETTPGIPDKVAIQKIENANKANAGDTGDDTTANTENLTQTDKFSQELFSTVATLNQAGEMDQTTVDKLTTSLADQIKNAVPKKIFLLSEMKIGKDDSVQAYKNYNTALNNNYTKNPVQGNALAILQEFINDGENVNVEALIKLDPIIKQTGGFMNGMVAISVPPSLAQLHLVVINSLERIVENLNDIQFYETDTIIAMGAASKFEENNNALQDSIKKIVDEMTKKING